MLSKMNNETELTIDKIDFALKTRHTKVILNIATYKNNIKMDVPCFCQQYKQCDDSQCLSDDFIYQKFNLPCLLNGIT